MSCVPGLVAHGEDRLLAIGRQCDRLPAADPAYWPQLCSTAPHAPRDACRVPKPVLSYLYADSLVICSNLLHWAMLSTRSWSCRCQTQAEGKRVPSAIATTCKTVRMPLAFFKINVRSVLSPSGLYESWFDNDLKPQFWQWYFTETPPGHILVHECHPSSKMTCCSARE